MPKIIENLREQITQEARRQLFSQGYGRTTVRSVASACNIGVGTVYNYFQSKELMISAFMLDDWHKCIGKIKALDGKDFEGFFTGVYDALSSFYVNYETLYSDEDAIKVFSMVSAERHAQFIKQLSEFIRPVVERACDAANDSGNASDAGTAEDRDIGFLSEYAAESVIYFVKQKTPIKRQLAILKRVLL